MVQTAFSRDPDTSPSIIGDRTNADVAQSNGPSGIDDEAVVLAIVACKSGGDRADPQRPRASEWTD